MLVNNYFALSIIVIWFGLMNSATADSIETGVVSQQEAEHLNTPFGSAIMMLNGETHNVENLWAIYILPNAGEWPHPQHIHAEEEFVVLTEGSGTWYIDGKEYPAEKGDVEYIAPWIPHTFRASKDAPAKFFVMKFSSKGVEAPEKPKNLENSEYAEEDRGGYSSITQE
ncbi:MAG: cupin domain-containing protein [Proteobacteria bacterium]|nr:cupin domain-containing protein [Pseudomonadota bacterium]